MNGTLLLALMLGAAIAGCGGGGATGGSTGAGGHGATSSSSTATSSTGTGGGPTAMEACNASATARCARIDACSKGALITQRFGSTAACITRNELNCLAGHAAPGTSATPAGTAACAAALANESCQDLWDSNPAPACVSMPGSRAEGAACAFWGQCQSAYCLVLEGASCGTCSPKPIDGAPCTTALQCASNQACPPAGVCTTFAQVNAACNPPVVCGAGLVCNSVCEAAVDTAGVACDLTKVTAPDCDRNLGLYCDATSKQCQPSTYGSAGEPCDVKAPFAHLCAGAALCVAATGTCSQVAADGEACDATSGPSCLGPARCVGGVCKAPDGAACL